MTSALSSAVSPLVSYLRGTDHKVPFSQVDHELRHLEQRENIATLVGGTAVLLGILSLATVILGGAFLMGALFAIATVAFVYAYSCRLAESELRNRVMRQDQQLLEIPKPAPVQVAATS